ncbi:MAG: ribosome biogenesis GTP-binding protein YihA/YsxC [Deltaproteobacteria bacterium]|nr:ribosome biogenesis GTP-binding protein YihA/YsxC [Deltaproteobacteria bacterium]
MIRILDASFVGSAGSAESLPEPSLPEVAFAGRSNVGKSSLLNALCGRRALFKVSQTPGRTRTIVHVEARLSGDARIFLVDLPGYGYAKVSKKERRTWGRLVEGYIEERGTLHMVVLLVDIRRGLEAEELALVEFLAAVGRPVLLAATKIDKLVKSRRASALAAIARETGVDVIGTSAETKDGIEELARRVAKACGYGEPLHP